MQPTTDQQDKEYRGTIIVDTCVLSDFSLAFPKSFRQKGSQKPQTYLDILTFLAKNGYHIIIPEMIAIEAVEMVADGKSVKDWVKHDTNNDHHYSETLMPFLKDVAKGNYPNIEIISGSGEESADNYCTDFNQILNNIKSHKNGYNGTEYQNKMKLMTEINALSKDIVRDDYGDKAIKSLLNTYPKDSTFVLTDDKKLLADINKNYKDNSLSSYRLLQALPLAKLFQNAGIKELADIVKLENIRRRELMKVRYNESYNELSEEDGIKCVRFLQHHPFLQSLKELAADIGQAQINPIVGEVRGFSKASASAIVSPAYP